MQVSPMDELPCYSGNDPSFFDNAWEDEEEPGEKGSSDDGLDQFTAHEETTTQEQFGWIEEPGYLASPKVHYSEETRENAMRQPADLRASKDEQRQPADSSVRASSFSAEVTLDDENTSGLSKENNLLTEQSPAADNRGKPKTSSLNASCEIEVIDLLSCSPDYRINPCFKKRRAAATVHPQVIDLTNSPIFVQL